MRGLHQFLVCLLTDTRCGDEDSELSVTNSSYEPCGLADTRAIGRGVPLAFCLQGELHLNAGRLRTNPKKSQRIAAAVAPRPGEVYGGNSRQIVFSICEWGDNRPWALAPEIGHLWRTAGDTIACFDSVLNRSLIEVCNGVSPARQATYNTGL
jgi:hypothetical protein